MVTLTLPDDVVDEVLSIEGQRRDLSRALMSVGGLSRLPDVDGEERYAVADGHGGYWPVEGVSLHAAVGWVVSEAYAARHGSLTERLAAGLPCQESSQGHDEAGEQRGGVHDATIAPTSAVVESQTGGDL